MKAILRSWAPSSGLFAAAGLASLAVLVTLTGCGEDKKKQEVAVDAGDQGPQKPKLDGKLAAAVKAAESKQAAATTKSGVDGPPDTGFFAPGLADKAHAPGAPPTVQVIDAGKEPRVTLTPAPVDEQRETVSVSVQQSAQRPAIQVDYVLDLKVDKPKGDKPKADKQAEGPRPVQVVGKVASLKLPDGLPRDASDALGKLKGTEIRYTLGPSGGAIDPGFTLPKGTDPALGDAFVRGLLETLGDAMPVLPKVPVGKGAYWMVNDRSSTFGVDVVRYRVYKVEDVQKDQAKLSVDVRQYAAKDDASLGGQSMKLIHFESQGKGHLQWLASALLSPSADVSVSTGLAGTIPSGQQGMFSAGVQGTFSAQAAEKKK